MIKGDMLPISYNLQLRKPKEDSPVWYREFHNKFYLFTLSNLLLLSYIKSYCYYQEISPEDEEKIALDIEKFLQELIEEIKVQDKKHKAYLISMGFEAECEEKLVDINLPDILSLTNKKNWYEVIKGLLNSWEFLCLYAITETMLKEILSTEGKIKEEDLVHKVFEKFPALEKTLQKKSTYYSRDFCEDIWKFYSRLRDIYAHSFGFITSLAKSNILGGLRENFLKSWRELKEKDTLVYILIEEYIDKSFHKSSIDDGKFFFLSDYELNIFRNFIINLSESLEEIAC